jgi:hypothetical protein
MERMGFNGKQVSAAGEAIGVKSYNTVKVRIIDKDDLSKTELLAMAALRAGLEPWSEETDGQLLKTRRLIELTKEAA